MTTPSVLSSTQTRSPVRGRWRVFGRRGWLVRGLLALGLLLAVGLLVGGLWLRSQLSASLPRLDGKAALPGLAAAVQVERDALGVPTVTGSSRLDVARATGFLHAQDRFFQMDTMRRLAAGELAGLLGRPGLDADRRLRRHRFRRVAEEALATAPLAEQQLVAAYTEGVNAGLAALGAPPFEYLPLPGTPQLWQPADSYLVLLAMFVQLQGRDIQDETSLTLLYEALPAEVAAFLTPLGTSWDAPLDDEPLALPPIPSPAVLDVRAQGSAKPPGAEPAHPPLPAPQGSNCFALAGRHTADGRGLLANDMHLQLAVPNLWYRMVLRWPEPMRERRLVGVTLPGTPVLAVGSNGEVAWGLTTSQLDSVDLVRLELDPADPGRYRTPSGFAAFETVREQLVVAGGVGEELEVRRTLWGPVVEPDARGRQRALRWAAHDASGLGFDTFELETASNVDQALAVARRAGTPTQNFLVADAGGRIGWTILGRVPVRRGFDGRSSHAWAAEQLGWEGWLAPEDVPAIVDPPVGRLWAANNRLVGGAALARLGPGYFDLGARAARLRDRLAALEGARPADLLAVQLDDRSDLLVRWQAVLLEVLDASALAADPKRAELRRRVEAWDGHAAAGSVGYRLVRAFRLGLAQRALGFLAAPLRELDPRAQYLGGQWQAEGPLAALVEAQPLHLLDPQYPSWRALLLAAADGALAEVAKGGALDEQTWGRANVLAMRHPLSQAVPLLGRFLDMPATPMAGDVWVPRIQTPSFGASQRLVVAPGREEEGLFHMPGGQSGHPLSPFYRAGHEAWLHGEATPLLPGPIRHTLRLEPAAVSPVPTTPRRSQP